jgi:hypothetical protein
MIKRGLLMHEEASGRIQIAGKHLGVSSPGSAGKYKLVVRSPDSAKRQMLELSEEAFDELEDILLALRVELPRYEKKTHVVSSLVMKKFMLDNTIFSLWPAREMAALYRQESCFLAQEEILEWRMALKRPDFMPALHAKLTLSCSRREIKEYCRLIIGSMAEAARAQAPDWYARLGHVGVWNEIEQNLYDAFPGDQYDRDSWLMVARRKALLEVLPDSVASPTRQSRERQAPEAAAESEPRLASAVGR